MIMAQKWRIGVLGAGWVSAFHLEAWRRLGERASVVALADPSAAARERRAAAFAIPATYADAATLFDEAEIDAVDICAPREFHADLVRLAADRGLPVLCQKPLAPTLGEAERLVADVGKRTRLMVHENWRFRRTYRRLREWLDAGYAGALRQVHLDVLSSGMIPDSAGERPAIARQSFFSTLDRLLVSEILIHEIDALRFLLGDLDLAYARLQRTHDGIRGEDVASLLLVRRADGLPVTVTANLAVHGAPPLPRDQLRIFGAAGTIAMNGGQLTMTGLLNLSETLDPDETYQGSYDAVMVHFLGSLESGAPFETSPADNLATLRIVEDAYAAGVVAPQ
ncbi:Gfo/Idh/MocA family protein [Pseudochelatococcus sp. B33]